MTEDPETIGAARALIEGGVSFEQGSNEFGEWAHGRHHAFCHVRRQHRNRPDRRGADRRRRLCSSSTSSGEFRSRRSPARTSLVAGDVALSFDDLVIATKIRALSETESRPALGIRFGTKLPICAGGPRHRPRHDRLLRDLPDRQDRAVGAHGRQCRAVLSRQSSRPGRRHGFGVRRFDRARGDQRIRGGWRSQRTAHALREDRARPASKVEPYSASPAATPTRCCVSTLACSPGSPIVTRASAFPPARRM